MHGRHDDTQMSFDYLIHVLESNIDSDFIDLSAITFLIFFN